MKISIVVPCYNEEEVLPTTISLLMGVIAECEDINLIEKGSELLFVDDGSKDKTWDILKSTADGNKYIKAVKLSRNRGHQNALLAGLEYASGDFVITIDADLQDDIGCIKEMILSAHDNYDIVYGIRKERKTDSFLKRFTAESYYKIMALLGVDLIFNHADFRGMSHRAVQSLLQYKEVNLFLRGMVVQLGFKTKNIYYDRQKRMAGTTKYPISKMLSFAWQGISSFSTMPLKFVTFMGLIIAILSFFVGCWALITYFCGQAKLPGWTSLMIPMCFLGGIQILSIGIVGEYLGKVYLETKNRPRFIISDFINIASK